MIAARENSRRGSQSTARPRLWRLLLAAAIILCGCELSALAQHDATEKELERYRQMLNADPWANPAMLDVDRGGALWKAKRGPRNASLEECDLGKGPGKVDGAFAELPRYFADADRVMDAEARIVWCMESLQGFARRDIVKPFPAAGQPTTELGALVAYVAHKASGVTFAPRLDHPKEKEALALGEALFFRRQGPMDFSCSTCHADTGKRIRLQALPYLSRPDEAKMVIGEWPAYRVSATHLMTMQHRIYDCFWQMRLPRVEYGSEVTVALTMYLVKTAQGGEITAPAIKR
jgi:sulfur-oxidizing protein SoxA